MPPTPRRRPKRVSRKPKLNYNKLNSGKSSMSRSASPSPTHPCPATTMDCDSCKLLNETINKLIDKVDRLEAIITSQQKLIDANTSNSVAVAAATSVNTPVPPCKFDQIAIDARLDAIEERIEERTNRQMRKTLVFRGIKESAQEKTWEQTDKLLASTIGKALDVNDDDAAAMIDRCHRGGNKTFYQREGRTRPVYAAMMCWKDCEEIIKRFRTNSTNVYCDYKYGPRTTIRRNLALKRRSELKANGTLDKAYIQFPARLMGKKHDEPNYQMIEDFSHTAVTLRSR